MPELKFAIIATDIALFTIKNEQLLVRLINVNRPPHFPNIPGLPGGLVDPKENAEQSAKRVLENKAGIPADKTYMEQLYTFSEIKRDPRGRVVAVAYLALIPWEKLSTKEQMGSKETYFEPVSETRKNKLAYDHNLILDTALARLRSRITYTTLLQKLMPVEFTLTELEHSYESILRADLDKRNFRKKILKLGILKELPKKRAGGKFRPAQLYSFKSNKVSEIEVL